MKITRITAYQVDLPLKEGSYSWSGQTFSSFDSTVIIIETDEGISGVGEVCPLGPSYLPAYAQGARTGIATLAENLIGENPMELDKLNFTMDRLLKGHPYVKSAIDMACWDILGKALNQPLYTLLGGKFQDEVQLFKVISRAEPQAMTDKLIEYTEQGFTQFQMKVGDAPALDIARINAVASQLNSEQTLAADANTGWRLHEAMRVADAVKDIDIYLEQPCLSYEECLTVRQHTNKPMILDECMDSLAMLLRGYQDHAMDLVNLKISRIGGLTRARQFRDLCVSLGVVLTIEDTWGGEIATSAIAHMGHSTPNGFHFQSSPFHEYHSLKIAEGGPAISNGCMIASDQPGLGVIPIMSALGKPLFSIS